MIGLDLQLVEQRVLLLHPPFDFESRCPHKDQFIVDRIAPAHSVYVEPIHLH